MRGGCLVISITLLDTGLIGKGIFDGRLDCEGLDLKNQIKVHQRDREGKNMRDVLIEML